MKSWLKNLDDLLRGRATHPGQLSGRSLNIPVGGIFGLVIVLGVVYGLCMGSFAVFRGLESDDPRVLSDGMQQLFASAIKVPLLFILTLIITFPSLYVFNALIGSQLGIRAVLKLLIAALGVNLAVLASLGPIVAFFSASSPNYPFILLLNVVVFAAAGLLSLGFLFQTLTRLSIIPPIYRPPNPWLVAEQQRAQQEQLRAQQAQRDQLPSETIETSPEENPQQEAEIEFTDTVSQEREPVDVESGDEVPPGPLDRTGSQPGGHQVRLIFCCWVVVYGLVGAQMGWVLRPFVGSPNNAFEWFRERDANFFQGVWQAVRNLMGI